MQATVLVLAALFLVTGSVVPADASAPTNGAFVGVAGPWTAVASSGDIDESALSFFATNKSKLFYKAGQSSTNPIVARYNVTSPIAHPSWTTLELGYFDNWAGAVVRKSSWMARTSTSPSSPTHASRISAPPSEG